MARSKKQIWSQRMGCLGGEEETWGGKQAYENSERSDDIPLLTWCADIARALYCMRSVRTLASWRCELCLPKSIVQFCSCMQLSLRGARGFCLWFARCVVRPKGWFLWLFWIRAFLVLGEAGKKLMNESLQEFKSGFLWFSKALTGFSGDFWVWPFLRAFLGFKNMFSGFCGFKRLKLDVIPTPEVLTPPFDVETQTRALRKSVRFGTKEPKGWLFGH